MYVTEAHFKFQYNLGIILFIYGYSQSNKILPGSSCVGSNGTPVRFSERHSNKIKLKK